MPVCIIRKLHRRVDVIGICADAGDKHSSLSFRGLAIQRSGCHVVTPLSPETLQIISETGDIGIGAVYATFDATDDIDDVGLTDIILTIYQLSIDVLTPCIRMILCGLTVREAYV